MWWNITVLPAPGKWKQMGQKFSASLCQKKKKERRNGERNKGEEWKGGGREGLESVHGLLIKEPGTVTASGAFPTLVGREPGRAEPKAADHSVAR